MNGEGDLPDFFKGGVNNDFKRCKGKSNGCFR